METYRLVPHESFLPLAVESVSVHWAELVDGRLMLRFKVTGCGSLAVPPFHGRGRADDLWKATCFELFLYDGEGRYREFNFSPCGQWAAWRFAGYRTGREDWNPHTAPEITHDQGANLFVLTAFISAAELEGAQLAAISAVLVEEGGRRPSYWALAHGGAEPDFHDPACFRIALPPRSAA